MNIVDRTLARFGYYRGDGTRSAPGQNLVGAARQYGVTPPAVAQQQLSYALSPWVFNAVSTVAEMAAMARLEVFAGEQAYKNHPMSDLLGPRGRPNDSQDSFELHETIYSDWLLTGNAYLYWYSRKGGLPEEVHALDPGAITIVPGKTRLVEYYSYRVEGVEFRLPPEAVTHWKRYHPRSRLYGLGAFGPLETDVRTDAAAGKWNYDFFDGDVFAPDGLLVVDSLMAPEERRKLEEDLNARYGRTRRTAVVGGMPGSTQYYSAGLRHRDADFMNGRMLSRQAVYECVGLPLGLFSESSTEAHAKVAERQLREACWKLTRRFGRKLNSEAMPIFSRTDEVRYSDIRVADWEQERARMESFEKRRELGLELPDNEEVME